MMAVSKKVLLIPIMVVAFNSCESLKKSSKFGFSEGYYKGKLFHKKVKSVYIIPEEDAIKVYTTKSLKKAQIDTARSLKIAFPANEKPGQFSKYMFRQNSFDLDILSILLKYRPHIAGYPNQLNTSILNGGIFLGYRTDRFYLAYKTTPFGTYKRSITHYGFSLGIFSGVGATTIDENVTRNQVNIQYDGFLNPSGIAAIVAVDKLSFALTFGIDHLLDKNHKFWIYQGKPWIGLGVGLNLN